MSSSNLPNFQTLWEHHETLYRRLFMTALSELAARKGMVLKSDENCISDELAIILNRLCYEECKASNKEYSPPKREVPIQPVEERDLEKYQERKKPDFTCDLTNIFADSPEQYQISFHVECKRLGSPSSPRWNLNKNYVTNGIVRFDSKSHEYGKRAPSGAMIGYVMSMTPKDVLGEVNRHIRKQTPWLPEIAYPPIESSMAKQSLKRKHVSPSEFALFHLWVDLRS